MKPKLLAFHLPQYHPIPENDEWWGPGFTEWRNVARATPLFPGHNQPHLPADLGYYDLRLPEARQQQADLARQYGIHGFCYYHYWFSGKQLLERPVAESLSSGQPDFPFCLCWANENWTRRWDGQDQEVLIAQHYSPGDDLAHIQALLPYFHDPRYIRIQNKPLFLVYRSSALADPRATTTLWRQQAKASGLEDLYLVKVESFPTERQRRPELDGFDAALDFQPDWGSLPSPRQPPRRWKLLNKLGLASPHPFRSNRVFSYPELVAAMLARPPVDYPRFPCVVPSWDNTARRRNGGATILHGSTPEAYGHWLRCVLADHPTLKRLPEPIVFINAWNEWAEGNHLEPDLQWGHGYLEQTRRTFELKGPSTSVEAIGD
jgi:lipopolysaccharide biosynthesis protein